MSKPFLEHNKMERLSNGPHTESALSESLGGIKHFHDFKKGRFHLRFLKVSKPFEQHNKMESKNNWTTFDSAFADPSGYNNYHNFKKADGKLGF